MRDKLTQAIHKTREACQYLFSTESRVPIKMIAEKAGIDEVLALACVHWLQVNESGLARIVADIYCPLKPDTFIETCKLLNGAKDWPNSVNCGCGHSHSIEAYLIEMIAESGKPFPEFCCH